MNYRIDNIISNDVLEIKELEYKTMDVINLDLSILKPNEIERFENFKSIKRKLEFYFTRVLIKSFNVEYHVEYSSSGKPVINEGHISISHAKNNIIVAYSKDYIIGIDIEYLNPKIEKIKDKFLSNTERKHLNIQDAFVLTKIWSIKEAVYKFCDNPGLIFKENILIRSLENEFQVEIRLINDSKFIETRLISRSNSVISYCYSPN